METFGKPAFPCPKCGQVQDCATPLNGDRPPSEGDFAICYACASICRFTLLGFLEEASEFDLSLLEEGHREFLLKAQKTIQNAKEGKVKFTPKILVEVSNEVGSHLAAGIAKSRDELMQKDLFPTQVLDNIILQSVIRELSVLILCAIGKGKDRDSRMTTTIQNKLNLVVEQVISEFGDNLKIIRTEIQMEEGEEHGRSDHQDDL